MKRSTRVALLFVVAGAFWLGWEVVRALRGHATAISHLSRQEWAEGRSDLRRYLRLRPGNAPARMLLAEAFARDESLDGAQATQSAIDQLQRIPDSSPLGAKARSQEGVLRFLVLHQPVRAERLLRRAIELDPNHYDAHYMLWKVLDLTSRSYLTEAVFWRVFELARPKDRPLILREWFLSEFSPGSGAESLDRMMGILKESEGPSVLAQYKRLHAFREAEPESPIARAALARLFLQEGKRDEALEFVEESGSLAGANNEPYYVATRVAILLDFGEFEQAEVCIERWPEPRSGYEYWKWKAIILDDVKHDDLAAIAAYDRALEVWPGNDDWALMHRKAHCYSRLGRNGEADEIRKSSARIESQMQRDSIARLRVALGLLDDPAEMARIVDFYTKLDRGHEAEMWEARRRELVASSGRVLPIRGAGR